METEGIKVEAMLDNIDSLKAEKCRLQETLNAVRSGRMRKQSISDALSRQRAEMEVQLANKEQNLKMIHHQVTQDKIQLAALRGDVAAKRESIQQRHNEVIQTPRNVSRVKALLGNKPSTTAFKC